MTVHGVFMSDIAKLESELLTAVSSASDDLNLFWLRGACPEFLDTQISLPR